MRPPHPFAAGSDPTGESRSAAWRRRLSRARELFARPRHHRRAAHRRTETARICARQWRGAGNRLRLYRAADRSGSRFRRTSLRPPIRRAPRDGSTCSPASSPTRRAASIASPADIMGRSTPRSVPKTFPILVREGTRLSQMRLRRGDAALDAEALARAACARAVGRSRRGGYGRRRCGEHRPFGGGLDLASRQSAERNGAVSSAIAPSVTPRLSMSSAAPPTRSPISGSRSRRARTRA